MSVTRYPAQSFEAMSRKQAITTCYALEDMRDQAVAEVARQKAGREIEQMMLRNALPKLAALDAIAAIVADPDAALVVDRVRAALGLREQGTSATEPVSSPDLHPRNSMAVEGESVPNTKSREAALNAALDPRL